MDEILRQVLSLFGDEFKEHSQVMAQSLIQADRSESSDERKGLMAEIFRRAHSIKGTAGTLGLFDLEDLAHAVETALTEFRSGEKKLVSGLAQRVLDGLDQAQRFIESVSAGGEAADAGVKATATELLKSASGAGPPPPTRPTPEERAAIEDAVVAPPRTPPVEDDSDDEVSAPAGSPAPPSRFVPPLPPPAETAAPTPDVVPARPEDTGARRLGASEVLRGCASRRSGCSASSASWTTSGRSARRWISARTTRGASTGRCKER
jgi:chemotaxis protein histidine kinase CheA